MKSKKTIWTTITGGLASVAPILFSVCKGGACVGVCVSPVASLFGISSATIAAPPHSKCHRAFVDCNKCCVFYNFVLLSLCNTKNEL